MTQSIQTILADWVEIQIRAHPGVPLLFVSGAQGIGKSTALAHLQQAFDNRLAILGLDDFYLTRDERQTLAKRVHPLFGVRGPPGTHDITFLRNTMDALRQAGDSSEILIPGFDKRIDDRLPAEKWKTFKGRPRAVLVEGWCVGAMPDLNAANSEPLNAVEAKDSNGAWRNHQEAQLSDAYAALWDKADAFFHLHAPSFEQVLDWRTQQEATTHGVTVDALPDEKTEWVAEFIQHYERLTRRMLEGGRRAGYKLQVDARRRPNIKDQPPLLVFSDLDGTLLDHETYAFDAAAPALEALQQTKSILVLASSKTAAEMVDLRARIGFEHCPAIVENGAGLLEPGADADALDDSTYRAIRSVLDQVPQEIRQYFEGFGDGTAERVSHLTGLSRSGAALAKKRRFSEPGRWTGPTDQLDAFLQHLDAQGVQARRGGRFLTLSFGTTKADQMFEIVSRYAPAPIIALGDAPNDVEMLEAANYAVVIRNASGAGVPALRGEAAGRVLRTEAEGPIGWNQAMLGLMQQLGIENRN
ncbi:MAG: HAD hydrolase family protein [Pseudomonadota bacterium]